MRGNAEKSLILIKQIDFLFIKNNSGDHFSSVER